MQKTQVRHARPPSQFVLTKYCALAATKLKTAVGPNRAAVDNALFRSAAQLRLRPDAGHLVNPHRSASRYLIVGRDTRTTAP